LKLKKCATYITLILADRFILQQKYLIAAICLSGKARSLWIVDRPRMTFPRLFTVNNITKFNHYK